MEEHRLSQSSPESQCQPGLRRVSCPLDQALCGQSPDFRGWRLLLQAPEATATAKVTSRDGREEGRPCSTGPQMAAPSGEPWVATSGAPLSSACRTSGPELLLQKARLPLYKKTGGGGGAHRVGAGCGRLRAAPLLRVHEAPIRSSGCRGAPTCPGSVLGVQPASEGHVELWSGGPALWVISGPEPAHVCPPNLPGVPRRPQWSCGVSTAPPSSPSAPPQTQPTPHAASGPPARAP